MLPFVKWPGGKRWAAPVISGLIEKNLRRTYYEPFLGGGAVFFYAQPKSAVLSDINSKLINLYLIVQRNPEELKETIRSMPVTRENYYRIREVDFSDPVLGAAQFLYLNRTAFGGIYRLNQDGKFNVPYGGGERTPATLWSRGNVLKQASEALSEAVILQSDFEIMLSRAGCGDVVYCDPTYTVAHENNGFVRYNERNFSWNDQERLARAAQRAADRGAFVLISNAHHSAVRNLYEGAEFHTLERKSLVSPQISGRRLVREYLIVLRSR